MDCMINYDQWVGFKLVPRGEGKTTKLPVNLHTHKVCSMMNPENWATWEQMNENLREDGAGFVLTDNDPFFCIDLDDCLDSAGRPNTFAQSVLDQFEGAAVELSVGKKGLHIWGSYFGELPEHTTRNPGIELYTSRRFIALGEWLRGKADKDCTAALVRLIEEKF